MVIKRSHSENGTYFCTFTCVNWLPLIEVTDSFDSVYNWLKIVNEKHQVCGFVIMPNHIHVLIHVNANEETINYILSNGKRFLAYEIVKRLTAIDRIDLLTILKKRVSTKEHERKKKHRVFEPSSDIKLCYNERITVQKLNYIHANPITGKWSLAPSIVDYPNSSAAFYELNVDHPEVQLIHYKDLAEFES